MSLRIESIAGESPLPKAGGDDLPARTPVINVFQTADQFFDHHVNARTLANFQTHLLNKADNWMALKLLCDYVALLLDTTAKLEALVDAKNALLAHLRENELLAQQLALWPSMLCHNALGHRDFVPTFMLSTSLPMALVTLQPNDRDTAALLVGVTDQPALFVAAEPQSGLREEHVKHTLERLMALDDVLSFPHFVADDPEVVQHADFLWNSTLSRDALALQQSVRERINYLKMGHIDGALSDNEQQLLGQLQEHCAQLHDTAHVTNLYNRMYQKQVVETWNAHRPEWQPLRQLLQQRLAKFPAWVSLSFMDAVALYYQKTYTQAAPPSIKNFYGQMSSIHTSLLSRFHPTNLKQLRLQIDTLQVSSNYVKDPVLVTVLQLLRQQCWMPMLAVHANSVRLVRLALQDDVIQPFRQLTSPLEVLQRCQSAEGPRSNLLVSLNAVLPYLLAQRRRLAKVDLAPYLTNSNKKLWLVVAQNNYLDMMRWDASVGANASQGMYTFRPLPEQMEKINILLNAATWDFLRPIAASRNIQAETVANMMETLKSLMLVDLSMFLNNDVYLTSWLDSFVERDIDVPSTAHLLPRRLLFPRDMLFVDEGERFLSSSDPTVAFFFVTSIVKLGQFANNTFWSSTQ